MVKSLTWILTRVLALEAAGSSLQQLVKKAQKATMAKKLAILEITLFCLMFLLYVFMCAMFFGPSVQHPHWLPPSTLFVGIEIKSLWDSLVSCFKRHSELAPNHWMVSRGKLSCRVSNHVHYTLIPSAGLSTNSRTAQEPLLDDSNHLGGDIRLVSFGMLSCRCRTTSTFLRLSRELSPIEAQEPSGTEASAYFYLILLIFLYCHI